MNRRNKPYNLFHKLSSIFMMMTLVWLTVSTPFVAAFQHEMAKQGLSCYSNADVTVEDEDNSNPFGNNTEEKPASNSSISLSEEYLHDSHKAEYMFAIKSTYHKCEGAATYTAFHGELLVPPPNFS